MNYIKKFAELTLDDIALVGGKNASLGQLIRYLTPKGILVPDGFALTTRLYHDYLDNNNFTHRLQNITSSLLKADLAHIQKAGKEARTLLLSGEFSPTMIHEIQSAYDNLCTEYQTPHLSVAVRSSATAEDLPTASFAGQQESFLNISGIDNLLLCCKKAIASLFTDRAIAYRLEKGFGHLEVAISVGIQKMVRSDLASSGVAFSLDTETGFKDVVVINGSFGLGESIVQGMVVPDEFLVHKPTLSQNYQSIINKHLGSKKIKTVFASSGSIKQVDAPTQEQEQFCLSNEEIITLAKQITTIEEVYSERSHTWTPIDVEWAKDGLDNKIYITQTRTETVHSAHKKTATSFVYRIKEQSKQILLSGESIGESVAQGTVRILSSIHDAASFQKGDILVTTMTNPDWTPILEKAAAIVTQEGGRTCHAAIVSRELGIPAIIGTKTATHILKDGMHVTVDCSQGRQGFIYNGFIPFEKIELFLKKAIPLNTMVMLNIADPAQAFASSFLPVAGVGLARIEFIIAKNIGIHPMAAAQPERIKDKELCSELLQKAKPYSTLKDFFVTELAYGIGTIAAAFYPRPVIVRLSDFKSNEYRNLKGGDYFEEEEENPMLGFRGAARYCSISYDKAFQLECAAFKHVRSVMGLKNLIILVPFVRTVKEAQATLSILAEHGLVRGEDNLKIFMMCEVPSNVVCINDFSLLFDGFSIGSNDLTQLTLGIDRSSAALASEFNEQDPAMKASYKAAIAGAHRHNKVIGSCGQGPSDYPELAQFFIDNSIDSISFDRDTIIRYLTITQANNQ